MNMPLPVRAYMQVREARKHPARFLAARYHWRFYMDDNDEWRWERSGDGGSQTSAVGYQEARDAVADAMSHGYRD
jgi:hypothetical protein